MAALEKPTIDERTMTEETLRQLDQIIDALHLEKATGLTRTELYEHIDVAATMMDLTTCLADVIDSMLLDIDDILAKVKTPLDDRDRSYFKEMRKLVRASRKWAQRATRETRHSERDDDLAKESDWWKNLILMVEDRTGTDELKTEIQNYVKSRTAPYKYPRIVEFRESLPKTTSGKIMRTAIRKADEAKYRAEQEAAAKAQL